MPRLTLCGPRTPFWTGPAVLTAAAIVFAMPAAAQTDSPAATDNDTAVSAQDRAQTPSQPGTNNNAGPEGPEGPEGQDKPNTPPSQRLPAPKPSDYGASTFNGPSDAELDQFHATHQPPQQTESTAQGDSGAAPPSGPDNTGLPADADLSDEPAMDDTSSNDSDYGASTNNDADAPASDDDWNP
ncbi:hypothetical protein V5738_06275 [Salinisphaera sp. SPP-AMP-43]|uniref:hypothetical protein n=1 Tax=Salinisphaera sp. SPP-AMP-43 TaxID=3121288 RepID=UPI003C6E7643